MIFQIASDLHLDTRGGLNAPESAYPKPGAEILLLAGDLCQVNDPNYIDMLAKVCKPFKLVLYVAGNHEYYGNIPMNKIDEEIERCCQKVGNVIYMNNKRVDIDKLAFIGTTMWTNCPNDSSLMNDFVQLTTRSGEPFSPMEENRLHTKDKNWVAKAITQAKDDNMSGAVVITHHAPLQGLPHGEHVSGPDYVPFYFSSDLNDLFFDNFIGCWAHGHTHETYMHRLSSGGDTLFVTNALGYDDENPKYKQKYVVKY